MSGDEPQNDWRKPEDRQCDIARANALREQASRGGLRFEVFLPPGLAEWILDLVARGAFTDPAEAVFVMLGEQQDLEPHADLREELLKRSLQASLDDPRPSISREEFEERMRKRRNAPRTEPAIWIRNKPQRHDRETLSIDEFSDADAEAVRRAEAPEESNAAASPNLAEAIRRRFQTAELSDEEATRIASSRVDPRHDHLNTLLDDEPQSDEVQKSR